MNSLFRSMLVCASVLVFSTGAFAAESTGHNANMAHDGKMMQDNTMHAPMMDKGMQHTAKYTDKAFLSAMIPHHEAAVDMAKDVLAKGKNPEVKKWANDVITSQQAEITQMTAWLKKLGGADKNAAKAMNDSMHSMMTTPMDKDADRNFVAMMIGHHASALEMATDSLVHTQNEQIAVLSKDILVAQAKEILAYKQWLKKNSK